MIKLGLKSVIKTKSFWEVLVSGLGWGEIGVILVVAERILSEMQVSTSKTIWDSRLFELVLVAVLISLGFGLAKRQFSPKGVLIVVISSTIGVLVGFALNEGVLQLTSLDIGSPLGGGTLARVISYLFLALGPALSLLVAIGSGFVLMVGVPFSVLRIFLPALELRELLLLGIIGGAAAMTGVLIIAGVRDWAAFLFLFETTFFLCPATVIGAVLLVRTSAMDFNV